MRGASLLGTTLLLAACVVSTPPPPPPPASPPAARVVLVSFDGLSADELDARGLPAFSRLAREGFVARRVIPVTPTQTSAAHVAILTGREPRETGIVANRLRAGDAFTLDIEAETLVEAAKRSGKRVGAIAFPTVDARNDRRRADFGLVWNRPVTPSRLIRLTREDFQQEWVPPGWTPGPTRRARVQWTIPGREPVEIELVAAPDRIIVQRGEEELPRDANGWFAITERVDGVLYGSWSRMLDDLTIYWGSISAATAYPDSFRKMIEEEAGFPPGPADPAADPEMFAQQIERLERFYTTAIAAAIRRVDFDLLLAYQPIIDQTDHPFRTVEPLRARAYAAADRSLAAIATLLDPSRDALVVTGDHGLAIADTSVRVNRLLDDWGFGSWEAHASGNVANLYGDDRPDELVDRLRQSGYFEEVTRRGADSHPNSGDIVAYSYPNVGVMTGEGEPVTARASGQHGGLASHPVFHTRLYAWGATMQPGAVEQMQQTEVAGFVAALAGIAFTTPRAPAESAIAPPESPPPRRPAQARPRAAARPSSPATSG